MTSFTSTHASSLMPKSVSIELNIVPNDIEYITPNTLRNGVILHKSFVTVIPAQDLKPDLIVSYHDGLISNAYLCVITNDAVILYLTLQTFMSCCNISIHGVVTVPLLNREDVIVSIWQSFDLTKFKNYADMDRVFGQSLKQGLYMWPTNKAQSLLAQIIQYIRNHQLEYGTCIIGEVDASSYHMRQLTSEMNKCALDTGADVGADEMANHDDSTDYRRLFLLALKTLVSGRADEELVLLGTHLLERAEGLPRDDGELKLFLKGCAGW